MRGPMSRYTVNILCTAHNNALSPLDAAAIHTFDSLRPMQKIQDDR